MSRLFNMWPIIGLYFTLYGHYLWRLMDIGAILCEYFPIIEIRFSGEFGKAIPFDRAPYRNCSE